MWKKVLKYLLPLSLCLMLLLVAVPGCNGEEPEPTTTEPTTTEPTTQPPEKDSIVVGMSRPLTGPLAIIGDSAFGALYPIFVDMVNAEGGIYVEEYGKKLPIELIVYDDGSDVNTMVQLTEKLIVEDQVDFLWPACGTAFLFAQAPIANKYGYVLITGEGGATQIEDVLVSLPYLFVTLSFSDWYQIPVLADMMVDKGIETAYIMSIADLHGIEYAGVAANEFNARGIEIVGSRSVPPDIADVTPIISAAKASGADAFLCFAYPDQVIPAVFTSMALEYNPKVWLGGPGVNFGFFPVTFGPAVEGITGWTMYARGQTEALDELADLLYSNAPKEFEDWWGHPCYWAGLQIWKQAIEQAGTLDQDAIRDIIANGTFDTVLGETWFDMAGDGAGGGLLSKDAHTGEVGQYINGVYEVVGPYEWATADWVVPKPEWPAAQ